MIYLVTQILIYLVVALALGFAGGWLLKSGRSTHSVKTVTREASDRVEIAEALREKLRSDLSEAESRRNELQEELADSEGRRELQTAEIASLRMDLNSFEDKDATINKFRHEADTLRQQLRSSQEAAGNYRSQLEIKARETAEYRLKSEKARQEVVALKKLGESSGSGASTTNQPAFELRTTITELTRLVEKRDAEVGELQKLLVQARKDASTMEEQAEIARSQLHALEAQLKDLQDAKASNRRYERRESSLSTDSASPSSKALRDELSERTRKYAVLDADYKILRQKYSRLLEVDKRTESEKSISVNVPETVTADAPEQPEFLLESPDGERDDLKQIFGIGPVIERTLNDIGIYHLQQIAGMSKEDIKWVAETIDYFPKRIEQDDWVKQARQLLRSGETSTG